MRQENSVIWEGKSVGPFHKDPDENFGVIVVASIAHGAIACRFDDPDLVDLCKRRIETGTAVTVYGELNITDRIIEAFGIRFWSERHD